MFGVREEGLTVSSIRRIKAGSSVPEDKNQEKAMAEAAEGGELGGPTGGTIGTLLLILVAGAFLLPGLGLVFVGPIAVALAGAGVAVGLMGALSDWGIPEERAQQYESGIHDGGILMGLKARSDMDARHLVQQWKASGGQHVHS